MLLNIRVLASKLVHQLVNLTVAAGVQPAVGAAGARQLTTSGAERHAAPGAVELGVDAAVAREASYVVGAGE